MAFSPWAAANCQLEASRVLIAFGMGYLPFLTTSPGAPDRQPYFIGVLKYIKKGKLPWNFP